MSSALTLTLVKDFFDKGPKKIMFRNEKNVLYQYLRDKDLIRVTKALLQRIFLLTTFMYGNPSRTLTPDKISTRVFLVAFDITFSPEDFMDLEYEFRVAAKDMVEQFLELADDLGTANSVSRVLSHKGERFPQAVFDYLNCFRHWWTEGRLRAE